MGNPEKYNLARSILGEDFISPEEVAKFRKLTYSNEQLVHFVDTLPAKEVLEWCLDNEFTLIAGPPSKMLPLEIRDLNKQLFYGKSDGWYSKQKFSRDDQVVTEWFILRKTIVPNSTSKTWSEQKRLISEWEYLPNAAETSWALTSYKEIRNIYLLPRIYTRTASQVAVSFRVSIGFFGGDGLDVYRNWDGGRYSDLGVVSARKRNYRSDS